MLYVNCVFKSKGNFKRNKRKMTILWYFPLTPLKNSMVKIWEYNMAVLL